MTSSSECKFAYRSYHVHGPATRHKVMECIRKEAECADNLTGFLALHSLAGGTGSGVGSSWENTIRIVCGCFGDIV